ncbi:MAG: hypothetical protein WCN98_03380 [Verrucomicrobiaceae bacterium]
MLRVVKLGGFISVLLCGCLLTLRTLRMMSCRFVLAGNDVPRSLFMMARCVFAAIRSLRMFFLCFL